MSVPTQKITKTRSHKRKSAYIRKQQVRLMNLARGLIGRAKGALKNKKPLVDKKSTEAKVVDAVVVEKKQEKKVEKAPAKKVVKAALKKAK